MSVAYYIVLDVDEPGFDPFVNGKALAHATEELDELCLKSGLPVLESFMGQGMDEFEEMLEEDYELPEGEEGDEKWFEPQEGIDWVQSLLAAISQNPSSVTEAEAVLDDLKEYMEVLEKAKGIHARWHLALDF